jgi:hypothetical protein
MPMVVLRLNQTLMAMEYQTTSTSARVPPTVQLLMRMDVNSNQMLTGMAWMMVRMHALTRLLALWWMRTGVLIHNLTMTMTA